MQNRNKQKITFTCLFRLASVYYEKFIYTNGEAWTNITKYIIQKYRRKREKPNMDENSSPA